MYVCECVCVCETGGGGGAVNLANYGKSKH